MHTAPLTFRFTGTTGTYFRLWAVDLLLTVITLGLYAPWARARRLRYFHGHTWLGEETFDYRGDPWFILKDRLLAALLLAGLGSLGVLDPWFTLSLIPALMFLAPWLMLRSRRDTLGHTSFRGQEFGFSGTYGGLLKHGVLMPLASLFTLGALLPSALQGRTAYLIQHARFGGLPFSFHAPVGLYLSLLPRTLGMILLIAVTALSPVLFGGLLAIIFTDLLTAEYIIADLLIYVFLTLTFFLAVTVFRPWWRTRLFNLRWNHTHLGPHTFTAHLGVWGMIALSLVNTVAIFLTLGLAIPWVRIRTTRFLLAHITLRPAGDGDELSSRDDATRDDGLKNGHVALQD